TERRYDYRCHGLRAELRFTHTQTQEIFTKTGWFATIDNGKIGASPEASLSLSSKDHNQTWLILYIQSNIHHGQYWFAGPQNELSPLMEWSVLTLDSQRLSFGEWQIRITISTDGEDRLERTVTIQAR